MKKYLCLSLCLGIMASACRLEITQKLDDANAKRAGGTQTDKTRLMTSLKKQEVLEACLPQINGLLRAYYRNPEKKARQPVPGKVEHGRRQFFLRRIIRNDGTVENPVVVLYTSAGMPLEFSADFGLGPTPAAVQANLKAMAASKVIQDQFVEREEVDGVTPPGYRVHISTQEPNENVAAAVAGVAPVSPSRRLIIYDPESIAAANVATPAVRAYMDSPVFAARHSRHDWELSWYDCAVDETTQAVTVIRTRHYFAFD